MKTSRTGLKNRTFRVQVARATKIKQDNLSKISISGEGVSSSGGCESREPNPTCNEEAEKNVTKEHHGDTCGRVPSDIKSVSSQNALSVRFSDEDKTKLSRKSSLNEFNDRGDRSKRKSNQTLVDQNITGLTVDIKSKPSIDYSSLIYKNYPKKIAGIKVTKKFLLMSKGLKWKQLVPSPETNESTKANKESISNLESSLSDTKEMASTNLIDHVPEISDETSHFEKTKEVAEPQIIVSSKDSKSELQIVQTFCPKKQKKSNFKTIVSKYTPKTYMKWHLSPTHVNMNRHKGCTTPILKCIGRYSPANMGYHNSSHLLKHSIPSDSSEVSNQIPYFKSTLASNNRKCHSRAKTKITFQTDEHESAKTLAPRIRKTPKGFFKSTILGPHIPSRIPISIKTSHIGSGHKNPFPGDENNEQTSGISSRKPSLGRQTPKISFEKHLPEAEHSRSRDSHKFHHIQFSPQILVEDKVEGIPEPQSRNSSIKREATKAEQIKHVHYQSLNRHHNTYLKDRGEIMGCNTWKEKVPLLEDPQVKTQFIQKSYSGANKKLYRETFLDNKIDDDVKELQNLINQHRKSVLKTEGTGKSKVENKDNTKPSLQDDSLNSEIKVIKTSYPYKHQQYEEQDSCCDINIDVNKGKHRSSNESKDECLTNKHFKEEKPPINNKKELSKVFRILLKRQDAEMKNNLFKYLMEESEKNLHKEKVTERILIKNKSALRSGSRESSRNSVSSSKRIQWESGESSKSTSRNDSLVRREESISPVRKLKKIPMKQRDVTKMDVPNKSDTSLFSEKVKTYKNLYSSSREAINMISEPPCVNTSSIVMPASLLGTNNFKREGESPSRRTYLEKAQFRSEKPFRNWLKSNNLIYDNHQESTPRTDLSPPLEESALYQNNGYNDNVDISYLFSSDENSCNVSNYTFDQQYSFCSSPTEYFFNSLSEAGINNNNTKHSVVDVMQNHGQVNSKSCSSENKSDNCKISNTSQGKSCIRTAGKYQIEPDKRLLANLNRRHTKKPIKMSMLPCSWQHEKIYSAKLSSTPSSQCSTTSLQFEHPKRVSWMPCLERKHSWSLASPDTIRSFSSDLDGSSLQLMKKSHNRTLFCL